MIGELLLRPGFTVFWVIETSVLLLFLTTIFGRPRVSRITVVFLGAFAALLVLFVIFTWAMGAILSAIVPTR